VICRVETNPKLGEIVHIHVNGLRFKNKHVPGGMSDQVGHLPFAAEALRNSVVKLESESAALPAFEEGYREWQDAFQRGEAGVWKTSVADSIAGIETALNQ
jgi:hypothetical protein